MFSARARAFGKSTPSRSFYLDVALLEDFWLNRKYHHTISAPLVYALQEALAVIEEEGLEARWARHKANHQELAARLELIDLKMLPPPAERLWSLNAVVVPAGVDEARVRTHVREQFNIEIGAGLGPLAGKIWRIGLMGAGSTRANVSLLNDALIGALSPAR